VVGEDRAEELLVLRLQQRLERALRQRRERLIGRREDRERPLTGERLAQACRLDGGEQGREVFVSGDDTASTASAVISFLLRIG